MAKSDKAPESRGRADGRRAFMVYLDPKKIVSLKKAALDDSRHAYEIVEEAVTEWLTRRKASKSKD